MPVTTAIDALRRRAQPAAFDADARRAFEATMNALPAIRMMGAVVDLSDPVVARCGLPTVDEHHLGGLGSRAVNGAVIAGLFDLSLGLAGTLQFPGERVGTIELSIKLMRPALQAPLEAISIAVKRTAHLAFTESELYAEGRLCAIATGIVAVAKGPRNSETYW